MKITALGCIKIQKRKDERIIKLVIFIGNFKHSMHMLFSNSKYLIFSFAITGGTDALEKSREKHRH